ncbi:hypothetical protein EVAR_70314_1 [Eumeta japonica]|uniref:Uncharacterized protein n=1 Tax=Eumeta variegata TaxID=151549 RepID=A0A4C2A442_EUMVA|nr:hypothetical protein EVAR_70314_1 [Eumeta japonica]
MISGCRTKFHVWAVLSRRVPPFSETSTAHQSARARSSVYDKRLPHQVSCLGRSKSKSSTVLGNQHRSPICSCTVSRFMISGCRTQVSCLGRSKSKSSTVLGNQHRSPICSCTVTPLTNLLVHGQSVYDKRLPHQVSCLGRSKSKSSTVLGNQHRSPICSCTVTPLTNLLVHGQSVYDKRLPHPKFHVWAVLSRRVPPFSETSTAHQSARARSSVYDKRLPHPSFMSGPFLVEEFHRSRKPAPLTNLLVHGQSVYDKRLPHPKFHVWAVLSRRVPPFSETSTAHQSARARSSVYDKRLPHQVSCLGRSKSKSSTVLGNQHRSPICSCTVSRFMISGCRTQVSCLGRSKSKSSTVLGNQHRSPICSCTVTPLTNLLVHGQSVYDKRLPHPSFMSGPFLVEEFHRSRKPAPLTNLLVHGQSVYDKRLPHPKFHVWAVLSRRVPPFSETSTAHQSARARSVGL